MEEKLLWNAKGPSLAVLLQLDISVPLDTLRSCQLLDLTVKQLARDTACLLREPKCPHLQGFSSEFDSFSRKESSHFLPGGYEEF